MIDYDGNKKMFVNDQAIIDYDNFMTEQAQIIEEDSEEQEKSPY